MKTLALLALSIGICYGQLAGRFSGPVRYNDQAGQTTNGDTWFTLWGPYGIRTTMNDGTGINSSNNSNVAFFDQNSTLNTIVLKNALTGLGGFTETGIGDCSGSESVKSTNPVAYNGLYIIPIQCLDNTPPFPVAKSKLIFSTAADDGAHWARSEDAYAVSAASCTGGTVTLATASHTWAEGDIVFITGITPTGYNGTYTATSGSGSATLKYAALGCPAAYVSGGNVLGPATANVTPPTTSMWASGAALKPMFVQYCQDNVACAATVDSNGTYLNGITRNSTAENPIPFRVLKSDMESFPGDASKYTYWSSGTTYGALGSASVIQCIPAPGASPVSCTAANAGTVESITYVTDSAITGGGMYIMSSTAQTANVGGQALLWWSTHIYGPYTLFASNLFNFTHSSTGISYGFNNPVIATYSRLSTSPYQGLIKVQNEGDGNDYSLYNFDLLLTNGATETAPPATGKHITNGLRALWRMQPYAGWRTLLDSTGNYTASFGSGPSAAYSAKGLENGNPNVGSPANAEWTIDSGFNEDLTDFSMLVVGMTTNTDSTADCILCPNLGAANGIGIYAYLDSIRVNMFASEAINCGSNIAANVWFSKMIVRKGTAIYCFDIGGADRTSNTISGSSIGSTAHSFSSNVGFNLFYTGTLGTIGIWNRALCSTSLPGTCAAGQVDEVVKEFAAVRAESKYRGWGF